MKAVAPYYWIGAVVLLVYLLTLCPFIYVGDSGELVTASAVLGVAHPPGYPLYVLLGRLFSLLPAGEIALRVNLLSALAGAAAASILALLLLGSSKGGDRRREAIVAAAAVVLLFAFARISWSQMVVAEVYGLNVLIIALILLALFRGARPALTFFLLGLGVANHQTVLLLLPGILYYYGVTGRLSLRFAAEGAAAFIGACTLYLYLLVRPDSPELFAWRKPDDWGALLGHMVREQYGSLSKLPRTLPLFASQTAFGLRLLLREMPLAIPLVPVALFFAWKRGGSQLARTVSIHFLFTSFGLLLLLNHGTGPLDAAVATVYYIPAILFAALMMEPLFRFAAGRLEGMMRHLSLSLIALPLFPLILNYGVCNARSFRLGDQAGRAMLNCVEENAAILTEGDNSTFVLYYLSIVEGLRPDVELLDRDLNFFAHKMGVDPTLPGRRSARDRAVFRLVASGERPVYSTGLYEQGEVADKILASAGPLYKFVEPTEPIRPMTIDLLHRGSLAIDHLRDDYIARRFAIDYLSRWVDHYGRTGDNDAFRETSEKLGVIAGDLREAHLVIGMGAASTGDTTEALRSLEQSLVVDPEFAAARRELAKIFVGLGNFERAAEEYRLAVEHEGLASDWLNMGNALYFDKQYGPSEEAYRRALESQGVTELVIRGVAKGLGLLGVDSLGVQVLEQLRASFPDNFEEYEDLADGYDRLGEHGKALELYQIAREREPDSASLAYKTGVVLIRLGRNAEAEAELEKVIESGGRTPGVMNALAYLYMQSGKKLESALELVTEAIELGGETETGYYEDTRGTILSRLGRKTEAEESFRRSVKMTPVNDRDALAETWTHLGDLLEEMGSRDGEVEQCRQKAAALLAGG